MITEELKEKVRQMARQDILKALKDAGFPTDFIKTFGEGLK